MQKFAQIQKIFWPTSQLSIKDLLPPPSEYRWASYHRCRRILAPSFDHKAESRNNPYWRCLAPMTEILSIKFIVGFNLNTWYNANIRQLPENAGEHLKFWEGCGYILCLHLPAMICTTIGPRSIEISFSKKIHFHANSTSSTQPVGQSRSVYIQQLLRFDDCKLRSSPKFSVQTDKRLLLTTD